MRKTWLALLAPFAGTVSSFVHAPQLELGNNPRYPEGLVSRSAG
jgi:hypothetical protein